MAKTFMDSDKPGFAIGLTGLIAALALTFVGIVWLVIGMFAGVLIQPLTCIAVGGLFGLICGLLAIRQSYVATQYASSAGNQIPRSSGKTIGIIACVFSGFILVMAVSPLIIPLALKTTGRANALTLRSSRTQPALPAFLSRHSSFSTSFSFRSQVGPLSFFR